MNRLLLVICLLAPLLASRADTLKISDSAAREIGNRLWKNECGGTYEGLTAWNKGEEFPSLGIGHFIWYPEGRRGPFHESFPELVRYLQSQGVKVPAWLELPCPWPNRAAFMADFDSTRMKKLRALLVETVPQQARFAALRLEKALPKMLAACPPGDRERVKKNFYLVAREPLGPYALVDYVNFKGEGVSPTERYNGKGWGLLQVLQTMKVSPGEPATYAFADAADFVLTRRVENSPPARQEARWLPGWRNRLSTYKK